MEIYVARQPIFDRDMEVFGYELLYRNNNNNIFTDMDDDEATTELIVHAFLSFGIHELTEGTNAFINFSKDLLASEVPLILPKEGIVIEILERGVTTEGTIEACKKMRDLGYRLAMDDFVFEENFFPLIDYVDIIKVDFHGVDYAQQKLLIKRYRNQVKFLAEKIETREEYEWAHSIGYDYFQGFFFSKPLLLKGKELPSLNMTSFQILEELNTPEPSYEKLAALIQGDLGMLYKIMHLVNSVGHGTRLKITSLIQALSHLGLNRISEWVSLMLLKEIHSVQNAEMIKTSLLRGKMMELLSSECDSMATSSDWFFIGVFSSLDDLTGRSMEDILKSLSLSATVEKALLGEDTIQRRVLDLLIAHEFGKLEADNGLLKEIGINTYMASYVKALNWLKTLHYER